MLYFLLLLQPCFKDYTIKHKEIYLDAYEGIAARSRYLGHVYIITSYRIFYDVIIYHCHSKMSMQLKEFMTACMKMGARNGYLNFKKHIWSEVDVWGMDN